jgi:ABC-type dipeptide/oligopeptide/nickel transport system permease component
MLEYMAKRLLLLIPVLLGVSLIIFVSIRLVPGDPAEAMAGEFADEEYVAEIRRIYGLDKPIHIQYITFMKRAFKGDLGRSILSDRPVLQEVTKRFLNTLILASWAMLLAAILGVAAGVISATNPYSRFDYGCMTGALIGISMPSFWLGLLLMGFFSVYFRWLPAGGSGTAMHLILPVFTLGITGAGIIARMTRSTMLEIINKEYVTTARSKGLTDPKINYVHALKNALLPVVTVIGLQSGYLLGGSVITESVFAWPGLGRYIVEAIKLRDYAAVQGSLLFFALTFAFVNLIVDLLYAVLNPRVRYGSSK